MLESLQIQNFRSIKRADLTFGGGNITVLIGANGSGKSNLVRCLEFLGSIPRIGLDATVRAQGQVDALFPKAMSVRELRNAVMRLAYTFQGAPYRELGDRTSTSVRHELLLQVVPPMQLLVRAERLRFQDPLGGMSDTQRSSDRQRQLEGIIPPRPASYIAIDRDAADNVVVAADPRISGAWTDAYLEWFGLAFLPGLGETSETTSEEQIADLLTSSLEPRLGLGRSLRKPLRSLLDGHVSSFLAFSAQISHFRAFMSGIRRFDLQIGTLRQQQDIAAHTGLSPTGEGLPAALRTIRDESEDSNSWQRLAGTLREIAPHVLDAKVSQLRSGQEFVQFIEARTGRRVESWQSSDGTLRALAILLAVETHSSNGIILIEEPEQSLHPWAVRSLMDHIREVAVERSVQIFITTHSEHVLDSVDPSEVILASRREGEGSTFTSLSQVLGERQVGRGQLGQLWSSGLLGAIPGK